MMKGNNWNGTSFVMKLRTHAVTVRHLIESAKNKRIGKLSKKYQSKNDNDDENEGIIPNSYNMNNDSHHVNCGTIHQQYHLPPQQTVHTATTTSTGSGTMIAVELTVDDNDEMPNNGVQKLASTMNVRQRQEEEPTQHSSSSCCRNTDGDDLIPVLEGLFRSNNGVATTTTTPSVNQTNSTTITIPSTNNVGGGTTIGGSYQPYKIRYTVEQEEIYYPTNHSLYSNNVLQNKGKVVSNSNEIPSTSQISIAVHDTNISNESLPFTTTTTIDESHFQPMGTWSSQQIHMKRQQHSFACTWQSNSIRHTLPYIIHGDGIYLLVADDDDDEQVESQSCSVDFQRKDGASVTMKRHRRYIDWTSQAVCANLGHTIPLQIINTTIRQMQTIPYIYSGLGVTEIKIRINALLNEYILPPPLVVAVYPNSGAEANEAGILLARRYTKRHKVISMYRSYHGATMIASSITGDYRRWYNEQYNDHHCSLPSSSSNNFIKAFHPFPLFFQHSGTTRSDQVVSALHMLEEQIIHEGPYNIASIVMESIIGAGGCCIYPIQYVHGIRAICNKYGILLHFDEIMVGFGRTGTMFGFQHYPNVIPDIVTVAKGITSAYMPLSMMACRKSLLDYFETIPLGWGSTYESHPVALATAYETIKYMIQSNTLQHVQDVSSTFRNEMNRLTILHPCIKQYRAIGLFGCFDIHDIDGCHPKLPNESATSSEYSNNNIVAYEKYVQAYTDNGLIGLHRYPHIHCAPPLIITKDELYDGFQRLHKALMVLDDALGFKNKRN